MPRTERFPDIGQRMTLFERYFGFRTLSDWLDILPYDSPGSISRIKNGQIGIKYEAIEAICKAAGITEKLFRSSLLLLAEELEVTDEAGVEEILAELSKSASDFPEGLSREDQKIISSIPGDYLLLYAGREDIHIDRKHIIIEKMKVSRSEDGVSCNITQLSNAITGEAARGSLTSRMSKISFRLSYKKGYYVDSQFLMAPVYFGEDVRIFFGIYLDIAPNDQNQLFATLFCMFSVKDLSKYPKRWTSDHECFSVWIETLLSKGLDDRGRLITDDSTAFAQDVRRSVLATLKDNGEA